MRRLRLHRLPIRIPYRRTPYPLRLERALADTFARLPLGPARDLLVSLVQAAEPLYAILKRGGAPPRRKDVEEVLGAACRAAEHLADLERGPDAASGGGDAERLATLRTGVLARFREGIAALDRLSAEGLTDDATHLELTRLGAGLVEDSAALAAAHGRLGVSGAGS